MAVRRWQVQPDETGVVDRQTLFEAVADAVVMCDRAGGVLSMIVGRAPTDLPGEMVTTGAIIEWKDRADAKSQPERAVSVDGEPAIPQPGLFDSTADDEEPLEVDEKVEAEVA